MRCRENGMWALPVMIATALVLAAILALTGPSTAHARELTTPTLPDGTTMTVSDDVTRIHVDKLDSRTHEFVVGARMQILVKETGEVVDEWTTNGTTHAFEKGLDVNVPYILREVEAPDGYAKIDDVEFFANEMEGTGITLVGASSDQADLFDGFRVALYEPHDEIVKEVVEERETEKTIITTSSTPATGDNLIVPLVAGLAVVAACAAACAVVALRRKKGE